MYKFLFKCFCYLMIPISIYLCFFLIVAIISFFQHKAKFELVKGTFKKQNIFYQLFMIPYMVGLTAGSTNPNTFRPHGVIMFEGRQGSGKTSAMIKYAMDLKEQYPLSKCLSNTEFVYSDSIITHWTDMLKTKNGELGLTIILDECQQWFNSKQSKDFPPEMLSYITQLRKERKIVLGTCQQFYMISKDIRTQVSEVRRCQCILGCFNFVMRFRPIVDSEGTVQKYIPLGIYWFVQTPKLREAYDTYKTIDNLVKSGFQENTKVVIKER